MNDRARIGTLIKSIREDKGLSVRELGTKSGICSQNIWKIEAGKYNVSIDILSKIAGALGYEITFFKRSPLRQFVFDNQYRDDLIGDLCSDLLKDDEFLKLTEESEQREKIISVGSWHSHIQEAVVELFREYNGEQINFEE